MKNTPFPLVKQKPDPNNLYKYTSQRMGVEAQAESGDVMSKVTLQVSCKSPISTDES